MKIDKYLKKRIVIDSRKVHKNNLFVCALGNYDKKVYINSFIKKKSLIISDLSLKHHLKVNNPNLFLYEILDRKYDYPLINKNLIGITGTDGKTTCATILRYMLNGASIGTNGVEYYKRKIEIDNTTPNLVQLFQCFHLLNKENIQNIVMEVSSESYLTNRIPYLSFDIGLFLNISKEHLDKHKSFNNYLECKRKLLENSRICIINRDTKYFHKITKNLSKYFTYGRKKCDLQLLSYKLSYEKTEFKLKYQNRVYKIVTPLLGRYNIDNLMAGISCMLKKGYSMDEIIKRILRIKSIPGRMEKMDFDNKHIMIDYAHTICATKSILKFLKKHCSKNIITVVGCAGGRYQEKRKIIGKTVLHYSEKVIFTMDDPRWENPRMIINEMIGNSRKTNYEIILNREKAIKKALKIASNDYLVLILGKGRDNYLAIKDKKIPYSDVDIINKYFQNSNHCF